MLMKKTRTAMSVFAAVLIVSMSGASLPAAAASGSGNVTVNVTSYGAKGTDTKSDSSAIQKALNMAKTTSGKLTVRIPKGTYYLADKLVVYSNTYIKLDKGAVIRRSVDDYFIVSYEQKYKNINNDYNNTGSVTIEGGKFIGGSFKRGAFNFWNANNITFKDITFSGVAGSTDSSHVLLMNGVNGLNVKNCTFTNCCTAKDHINSEAVHIDFIPEGFEGAVKNIPCKNVTVTGCTFNNVASGVGTHHANNKKATNIKVQNNTFKNVKYVCVDAPSFNKVYVYDNKASNVGSLFKGNSGVNYYISGNSVSLRYGAEYRSGKHYYPLYGIMAENCSNVRIANNSGLKNSSLSLKNVIKVYIDGKLVDDYNIFGFNTTVRYVYNPRH